MPTTTTVSDQGGSQSGGILDTRLVPDGSVDPAAGTSYSLDGNVTLQSLFIGSTIEVDLGSFFGTPAALTGTGNILGVNDPNGPRTPLVSNGGSSLDINGMIAVNFYNEGSIAVSNGERLDIEGDLTSVGASTITVAAGGELDVNSQNTAILSNVTSNGTLRATAPNTTVSGDITLAGTVIVQGDALNGAGDGALVARNTGSANGSYVATFDIRNANLLAPINSLTLGQDALVRFGSADTTVKRFAVAGSATALAPLDVVSTDGTVIITGDGSGTANQVSISQAELTGGTFRFAVAASDGGALLQNRVLVNAPIENVGAMTVAGNATFMQQFTNTGTVTVTMGTLSLAGAVSGAGTIAVESGATLAIAAADQNDVVLRNGSVLQLSQPTAFTGTIQMPATGARIDLLGTSATGVAYTNGAIVVTTATGTINLAGAGLSSNAALSLSADGAGGTFINFGTSTPLPNPVAYRFFDSVYGTQFLTTSLSETQNIQATRPDLVFEGVGLSTVNPAAADAAPVFRFFDSKFGTHFYTASATERDTVLNTRPDLVNEGVGFYEHTTQTGTDVPVLRYFDSTRGTHFYTSSTSEQQTIAATRPDLIPEGVGFYAPT